MRSSQSLLNFYLLELRRRLTMLYYLLLWLIYQVRMADIIIDVWFCHLKHTLCVVGLCTCRIPIRVKVGCRIFIPKFFLLLKPEWAFLVWLAPRTDTWDYLHLRLHRIVRAWADPLLIRVFLDRCETCDEITLMVYQRLGRLATTWIAILIGVLVGTLGIGVIIVPRGLEVRHQITT